MKTLKEIGLIGLLGLIACGAVGQLTVTVTPGYQFGPTETPSASTLNLLGQPSITVAGTVSGSVGLAAKSVTGVYLADSVVDGVTLDYTAASPRNIEIKAAGVGVTQIATAIAGAGLSGGGGSALAVQVDGATIIINPTNKLALGTSLGPGNLNFGNVALSAGAQTINWTNGWTYVWTLGVSNVLSFTNQVAGQSIITIVKQDGSGGRTVTWPAGIKWRGGAAPTLSTATNVADVVQFIYAGGTTYGTYGLNFQ